MSGSKIVVALNYLALIWRDLEVMESNGKDLVKLILMYPASLYLLKVNYTNPRTRCEKWNMLLLTLNIFDTLF